MQLTVEFEDASRIAALAQLAEMMELTHKGDSDAIRGIYPLDIISATNRFLDALDNVLDYIDSPYGIPISGRRSQHAGTSHANDRSANSGYEE